MLRRFEKLEAVRKPSAGWGAAASSGPERPLQYVGLPGTVCARPTHQDDQLGHVSSAQSPGCHQSVVPSLTVAANRGGIDQFVTDFCHATASGDCSNTVSSSSLLRLRPRSSGISARVGRTGDLRRPGSRMDVLLLAELHDRVQLDASPGQPSWLQRAAGRPLRAPGRRILFANRQLVYKGVSGRRIRNAARGRASIQFHGKARGPKKSDVKAK